MKVAGRKRKHPATTENVVKTTTCDAVDFGVAVVIPAAGNGQRLHCIPTKQYRKICGKAVICHTVQAFVRVPWVKRIIVVTDDESALRNALGKSYDSIHAVKGSSTRHRSIKAGLQKLKSSNDIEVIVIHDGVRPIVSCELLRRVVVEAHHHGASGAIRPLVSTVLECDKEGPTPRLIKSLDRQKHVASEMPQAFQAKLVLDAYDKITEHELEFGTECLELVRHHCGAEVKLVDGPESLWKLTYQHDMPRAQEDIAVHNMDISVMSAGADVLSQDMYKELSKTFHKVRLIGNGAEPGPEPPVNVIVVGDSSTAHELLLLPHDQFHNYTEKLSEETGIVILLIDNRKFMHTFLEMTIEQLRGAMRKRNKKVDTIFYGGHPDVSTERLLNTVTSLLKLPYESELHEQVYHLTA